MVHAKTISDAAFDYAKQHEHLTTEEKYRLHKAFIKGAEFLNTSVANSDKALSPSEEITDNSPMPFGKYVGKAMVNVPAVYLIWLFDNSCNHTGVKKYITDNLAALKKEANKVRR